MPDRTSDELEHELQSWRRLAAHVRVGKGTKLADGLCSEGLVRQGPRARREVELHDASIGVGRRHVGRARAGALRIGANG